MKKRMICLMALLAMVCVASAQQLVLFKSYGKNWRNENVSMVNKPNGIIYRLRIENQNEKFCAGN